MNILQYPRRCNSLMQQQTLKTNQRESVAYAPPSTNPVQHVRSNETKQRSNNDFILFQVDIDEVEEAAEEHLVQMVPTFMAFKNGKKIDGIVSAKEEDLTAFIAKHKG